MSAAAGITPGQAALGRLWWGPGRRLFEPVVRRLWGTSGGGRPVVAGPLAGLRLAGGLAEVLGIYELPVQEHLLAALAPGRVVYDVGANHGYLSLLAAVRVGPAGRVVAFEPVPASAHGIERAVQAAGLAGRIEVVEAAVAARAGRATLHLPGPPGAAGTGRRDTEATLLPPPAQTADTPDRGERLEVAVTSLDAFAITREPPDFVKVDVEGAEADVLEGAAGLLAGPRPPAWLVECHGPEEHRAVAERLAGHGYRLALLEPPGWPMPRPGRPVYPLHLAATPPGDVR